MFKKEAINYKDSKYYTEAVNLFKIVAECFVYL